MVESPISLISGGAVAPSKERGCKEVSLSGFTIVPGTSQGGEALNEDHIGLEKSLRIEEDDVSTSRRGAGGFGAALRAVAGVVLSVVGKGTARRLGRQGTKLLRRSPINSEPMETVSFYQFGAALAQAEGLNLGKEATMGVSAGGGKTTEPKLLLELFEIPKDIPSICRAPVGRLEFCILPTMVCNTPSHITERSKSRGKQKNPPPLSRVLW